MADLTTRENRLTILRFWTATAIAAATVFAGHAYAHGGGGGYMGGHGSGGTLWTMALIPWNRSASIAQARAFRRPVGLSPRGRGRSIANSSDRLDQPKLAGACQFLSHGPGVRQRR